MTPRRLLRRVLERTLIARARTFDADELRADAVVVSPHPDDETLGCGGTIVKKRAAGARVIIVFLSDGAASHAHLIPAAELAELRTCEALAAARVLGVAESDVRFLGHPDGRLTENVADAAEGLRGVLEELRPRQVFLPYRGEMPPDHFAGWQAGMRGAASLNGHARLLEYPVWFWQHLPWARMHRYAPPSAAARARAAVAANLRLLQRFRTAQFIGDVLDRKRAALACHATQTTRRNGDPRWSVLGDVAEGDFISALLRDHELFCELPA
jgi:LmbE family N-acetylglucosaminyl deacetylase